MNKLLSALVIASGFLSGVSVAADIEQGVMKDENNYYGLEKAQSNIALNAPFSKQYEDMSAESEITPFGPARGISYFEIGLVRSANGGDQTITKSAFSTGTDHGGSYLYVYAWQVGYGNPNNATMNGQSKSAALSEARCGSDLHRCRAGETVTGWLYGWDFSGQQNGQVKVSSNSVASPFGNWSDSLYIN
ncbi:DUF4879 domain-containing protein [Pseudoalteromonas aurantia]|uniref:DUF4879 domain-containing protein n=1 Tax=Pseudoalteromonas aurantia 208 TaxID=1314867 RepID=A0ABR9EI00_9GAMM|nr:DUF4879 domain-containing protein [Pseudoalteromonas aurantia]MBE0370613.1 hypothetical protein [Pseudoalteromonas aurantia 208]